MKKLILLVFFGTLSVAASYGQELGVRFGNSVGGNVAIDGVFSFKSSRIHADVSFGDGVGVAVIYDFIVKPISGEAFNWYQKTGINFSVGMRSMGKKSALGSQVDCKRLKIVKLR